jgi:hypothetical protein
MLVYPITFAANLKRSKLNKTHHNNTPLGAPSSFPDRLGKRENIGYTTAETMAEHLQRDRAEKRLLRRGNSNNWVPKITGPITESEVAMLFEVKQRPLGAQVAAKTA